MPCFEKEALRPDLHARPNMNLTKSKSKRLSLRGGGGGQSACPAALRPAFTFAFCQLHSQPGGSWGMAFFLGRLRLAEVVGMILLNTFGNRIILQTLERPAWGHEGQVPWQASSI